MSPSGPATDAEGRPPGWMALGALYRRFPGLAAALPSLSLGGLPTPVQRLTRLSASLGTDIWIKRDDRAGDLYGGNKVRKLQLLLAAAQAREARTLVTMGGLGSHHVLATGAYGRRLGMRVRAVVSPQPVTPHVRENVRLGQRLGVELLPCRSRLTLPFAFRRAARDADAPYLIGPGGSSPLGTLGFVDAGLELAEQVAAGLLPSPTDIFIPLGSGGSLIGLAVGCRLAGLDARIHGVRVVERPLMNSVVLRFLAARTRALLADRVGRGKGDLAARLRGPRNWRIVHGFAGRGYGTPTAEGHAAAARLRDLEGVRLEPIYTAKALAALLSTASRGGVGSRALFWHTYNGHDTSALAGEGEPPPLPRVVERWLQERCGDLRE